MEYWRRCKLSFWLQIAGISDDNFEYVDNKTLSIKFEIFEKSFPLPLYLFYWGNGTDFSINIVSVQIIYEFKLMSPLGALVDIKELMVNAISELEF